MPELNELMREFTGQTAITILFLISGSILVANNRTVGRKARRIFLMSLVALAFIAFADWITNVLSGVHPQLRWLHATLIALYFSAAPFVPVAIADTVFPEGNAQWPYFVLSANVLLELASIFGSFVFSVDAQSIYHRESLYFLYMLTYAFSAVYLSVKSIKAGRTYQSASMGSVISILVCMSAGVGIQVFDGKVFTTWPAASMAVVLFFVFYADMVLRTDALTKLLNRHSYDEFVAHPPLPCTVLLIDIDDFKHVNDTYGHAYGDEVLAKVGSLLLKVFGSHGLCYRTGGDEFTVVLEERLGETGALIARLEELIAAAREKDNRLPGVSVGKAQAGQDCTDIAAVVKAADEKMYEEKRARKVGR